MRFGVGPISIVLFNIRIPFWIISIILLIYILYLKIEFVSKLVKLAISKIYLTISYILTKIKQFILWIRNGAAWKKVKSILAKLFNKTAKFMHIAPTKEAKNNYALKQIYVTFIFLICIFIFFSYTLIIDIYIRNIPPTNQTTFLLITLLIFLSVWIIFMFMSSIGFYLKDTSLWFFMLFPLFMMYHYHNKTSRWIGIIILSLTLIIYPHIIKAEKKPRLWFWGTILLMVASLFSGMAIVDDAFGNKPPVAFSLNLNGNQSTPYADGQGKIYCLPSIEKKGFIVGDNLTCIIRPRLKLISVNLTTYIGNMTISEDLANQSYSFKTKNNTTYLYFQINAEDKSGKGLSLSTGMDPSFESYFTIDEQTKRKESLIKYLGILFTAVFVSIPIMIYHLRHLTKRNDLNQF